MQLKFHTVTIEDLMPQDHFLRRLEAALDLSFVRVETAHLYSRRYGRPPIDPVVLVKYLLVGFLYGIPSERQIEQRIQTDVALRWYLGLDLFDRVPDHSTISQLRRRKPSFRKIFRRLFEEVVGQCVAKGLASGRLVGTDSTHVKANASWASEELVELPESPGVYWERLDTYEEEGLEDRHDDTAFEHCTDEVNGVCFGEFVTGKPHGDTVESFSVEMTGVTKHEEEQADCHYKAGDDHQECVLDTTYVATGFHVRCSCFGLLSFHNFLNKDFFVKDVINNDSFVLNCRCPSP